MLKDITSERIHELFYYNPKTGIFINKTTRNSRAIKGHVAGTLHDGYLRIKIDYNEYLAHRLAWFYVYGYLPENGLDHRDRIKHHNWISNLRETTNQCNIRNTGNFKSNTSGVKGVYWNELAQKWYASIMVTQKTYYLGIYKDYDNAVCARLATEQCLNWEGCDSSSPAFQYVQKMLCNN